MKIGYVKKAFSELALSIIDKANRIISEYEASGYSLTLRQLYYQFVSRDWFPPEWADKQTGSTNNERSYKKLGDIISDARRAGLVDWYAIEDRTRYIRQRTSWKDPQHILRAVAEQFCLNPWRSQTRQPEVWIEKDALVSVIEGVCDRYHVPHFSCRGYTSDSEIWRAAMRMHRYHDEGREPIILHLGDHDPSGQDMTRDVTDRLALFRMAPVKVVRLALNMDQVEQYQPPPNPAKVTDSRYQQYVDQYGEESWELDALDPKVISDLVEQHVKACIDFPAWNAAEVTSQAQKDQLIALAERWPEIARDL